MLAQVTVKMSELVVLRHTAYMMLLHTTPPYHSHMLSNESVISYIQASLFNTRCFQLPRVRRVTDISKVDVCGLSSPSAPEASADRQSSLCHPVSGHDSEP